MNTVTVAKNIGKLGNRTLFELLLIKYRSACQIDFTVSISAGKNHGLGISLLCPWFLCEIDLFPLTTATHVYYLENG